MAERRPPAKTGAVRRRARILAIVMAGGRGERLHPLTRERSKAAVPFGGRYRIIDFVLSNFVNSGIGSIYVLIQYFAQSLIEHLRLRWQPGSFFRDQFVAVVPPQMRMGEQWFRGTADAVTQNLNLIRDFNPDLVAVFGADHVYRMDINQMVAFHVEHGAEVTVAALPVPLKQASAFGIIETDVGHRIIGWAEKPKRPKPMPTDPARALASMGNYLFNTDVLVESLLEDARRNTEHDFGKTIIPQLIPPARVFAYDFLTNRVPGLRESEEPGYWRDVGTIKAYFDAHMDLLGEQARFDLHNEQWPILAGGYLEPPVRILRSEIGDSIVTQGCALTGATLHRAILGRGVRIEEGAVLEDAIVMDHGVVGKGCHLKRVIVDRYNILKPGTLIGFNPEEDRTRYHLDPSGIVVIPRGGRGPIWRLTVS